MKRVYEINFFHTVRKVKEFRELSNKEIKMVGQRISFSDNLQKQKFRGRNCGPFALPW